MKSFIVALSILIVIIIGLFSLDVYLNNTVDSIDVKFQRTEFYIQNDMWDDTKEEIAAINSEIEEISPYLNMIIDHQEIDNIKIHLKMCEKYLNDRQKGDILSELSQSYFYLNHILHKNELTLANIF